MIVLIESNANANQYTHRYAINCQNIITNNHNII